MRSHLNLFHYVCNPSTVFINAQIIIIRYVTILAKLVAVQFICVLSKNILACERIVLFLITIIISTTIICSKTPSDTQAPQRLFFRVLFKLNANNILASLSNLKFFFQFIIFILKDIVFISNTFNIIFKSVFVLFVDFVLLVGFMIN